MESHFAVLRGIGLHYLSAGEKGTRPLMVFLHGFPEYSGAWAGQMAAFSPNYFTVALDLRGFNLSDKPKKVSDYRIDALMGDVSGLIEHLGYSDCVLVAHDWGGAIAWAFATHFKSMVRRLVIINAPHAVPFARALAQDPAQQAASQYMLALRRPDAAERLLAQDCVRLQAMFKHPVSGKSGLSETEMATYVAIWQQPGAMDAMLNYYRATPLLPPVPGAPDPSGLKLEAAKFRVEMPTLVIWGMQDTALLPVLLEGLQECVADLRVVQAPSASHWVVHEAPELVTGAIRDFLGD
ncbi:MAG: alpha/beta hydrolase [Hyphomicrobiales bacterium]|nr:alpha/beta hydrolase [Hyphomicrobiales bacterium]MDE2116077.1 alpha/beta hydrolase [Hyphomicrobiales bacterium]